MPDSAANQTPAAQVWWLPPCPELSGLPERYAHRLFDAPEEVLKTASVALGKTYPKPLIEHDAARKRALGAYKEISGPIEP
jgi:deoxyribodipyrimidine photo-lyase